ncbi:MAG: hypothetical protein WD030_06535, partial [Pirellulales bacterium]
MPDLLGAMKQKLSTTKLVLILLGLIFVLLIAIPLVSIFWPAPAIVVSKETTYVTGPLDDEGRVDYLAALEQKYFADLPPRENAAREYVQAFSEGSGFEGVIRLQVLQRLDLVNDHVQPPFLLDSMEFAEANLSLVEQTKQAQGLNFAKPAANEFPPPDAADLSIHWHDVATLRPWQDDEFSLLAAWLDEQQQPLAHIRAGAKLDRCYFPIMGDSPDEPLIFYRMYYTSMRLASHELAVSAMRHLGKGNGQQAWKEAITMLVSARHLAQQPGLVANLYGIAMDGIALETVLAVMHHGDYTAEELARMAEQFDQLAPLEPMAEEFRGGERLWMLEVLQAQASGKVLDDHYMSEVLSLPGIDWNIVMRMANEQLNRFEATADAPPGAERDERSKAAKEALDRTIAEGGNRTKWAASVFSRKSRSELIGSRQMSLLLPAFQAAIHADDQARVRQLQARAAIALAQYRAAHGEYPDKLAQLAPEFAAEEPKDYFTGQPLKYLRTAEGYHLYSVGPNGQDNGGLDAKQDETGTLDYDLHDDCGITV